MEEEIGCRIINYFRENSRTFYDVEVNSQMNKFLVKKTYTQFKTFYDELKEKNNYQFKDFPKKNPLSFTQAVIEKRVKKLN